MQKPNYHILVCNSFRVSGTPQGMCNKKGASSLMQYLQEGINERNIEGVTISLTNCLNVCDRGPVMVVYPQNYWYGGITEERIDEILDALVTGAPATEYLLT
jgi:(2Fe-2S) ferredoxin